MKTQKVNFIALVALVIGIITMSFKLTEDSTTYHFTGDSTQPGEFAKTSNWAVGNSDDDCQPLGDFPCEIEVPNESSLLQVIGNKSNEEVLDINPLSKRN